MESIFQWKNNTLSWTEIIYVFVGAVQGQVFSDLSNESLVTIFRLNELISFSFQPFIVQRPVLKGLGSLASSEDPLLHTECQI